MELGELYEFTMDEKLLTMFQLDVFLYKNIVCLGSKCNLID